MLVEFVKESEKGRSVQSRSAAGKVRCLSQGGDSKRTSDESSEGLVGTSCASEGGKAGAGGAHGGSRLGSRRLDRRSNGRRNGGVRRGRGRDSGIRRSRRGNGRVGRRGRGNDSR